MLVFIGSSAGLGFISGFAIKKLMKIVAVIAGLAIMALAYLQYQKIISVNWTALQNYAYNTTSYVYQYGMNVIHQTAGNMNNNTVYGIAGGFLAGFLLGFHKG